MTLSDFVKVANNENYRVMDCGFESVEELTEDVLKREVSNISTSFDFNAQLPVVLVTIK